MSPAPEPLHEAVALVPADIAPPPPPPPPYGQQFVELLTPLSLLGFPAPMPPVFASDIHPEYEYFVGDACIDPNRFAPPVEPPVRPLLTEFALY